MNGNTDYIESLVPDWITPEQATRAINLLGLIPIPDTIAPGPDGIIGFTWRIKDHYFNLEILGDGNIEVFYENLLTGGLWSI